MLVVLAGGDVLTSKGLRDEIAARLGLSEADETGLHPSGAQSPYANRIDSAVTNLAGSVAVTRPRRGQVRITARGRAPLAQHQDRSTSPCWASSMSSRRSAPPATAPIVWVGCDPGL